MDSKTNRVELNHQKELKANKYLIHINANSLINASM